MKTIKCQVRCTYWDRPEGFEVDVPDNATEDEIESAMRDAAADAAGFEFWREDDK